MDRSFRKHLSRWFEHHCPPDMPPLLRRRALMGCAGAIAASAFLSPVVVGSDHKPRFSNYPFALGVASGSPRPHGVVIWTRLARYPMASTGMPQKDIIVRWEVALDQKFRKIVQKGSTVAAAARGHSVHVELSGLAPARWYWYRFMSGDAVSPTGRTRTAPAPGSPLSNLRFAFASCQNYQHGYYAVHRHLAAEYVDAVLFLGDYIYETSTSRDPVRPLPAPEARTLDQYRERYAIYKSDPDLQLSHAAAPWIVTWDDHEVSNDHANDRSTDLDPDFLLRRVAAYQAYYENMPLPVSALPRGHEMQLYDSYEFGSMARFFVLDSRQYRAHQVCPRPGRGGSNIVENCAERTLEERSLLGTTQEGWLAAGLADSKARWNVIGQQTLMAQLDRRPGPGQRFWSDGWDGYPNARARLLDDLVRSKASNPLVVSGDVHCNWIADLKRNFDDERSPVVATELCGTSIASRGPSAKEVRLALAENPHLKFGDGDKRGYTVVEIRQEAATATLRAVEDARDPESRAYTLAIFEVRDGRPGAQRI